MSNFVLINNFKTTLAAAASSSATTLTLASSTGLPTLSAGQQMPLTLNDAATGLIYEIVYVTAITGATLTVLRGQDGTAAQSWLIGDYSYVDNTAGVEGAIQTTANLGVTNAATAQSAANTAIANAATAQSTANTALAKAGFAQTVTAYPTGRVFGTTYTNPSSTKSMFVSVTTQTNTVGPTAISATIAPVSGSAVTIQSTEALGATNISMQIGFPVPPGASYSLNYVTNLSTLLYWVEWD